MNYTTAQLEAALADTPSNLELLVREWLVLRLKSFSEVPPQLAERIRPGLSASELTAANVAVIANGTTGDEDTPDRTRYAVACSVVLLFDWKTISLDSFEAACSIISRACRDLVFDTAFIDYNDDPLTYWIPNNEGTETDVVAIDSPYWDSQTGRMYNNFELKFTLYFRSDPEASGFVVYPATPS
jgi:hypothetical protein